LASIDIELIAQDFNYIFLLMIDQFL